MSLETILWRRIKLSMLLKLKDDTGLNSSKNLSSSFGVSLPSPATTVRTSEKEKRLAIEIQFHEHLREPLLILAYHRLRGRQPHNVPDGLEPWTNGGRDFSRGG